MDHRAPSLSAGDWEARMTGEKLSRKWLKNHLAYCWWKYLAVAVACAFGVDLLFSVTAYRPPQDKKQEIFLCSGYADAQAFQTDFWPWLLKRCPEQEELLVMNIDLTSGDMYAPMQFSTYCAAQQGDVCLLPRSEFFRLTADGADAMFLDLSGYIASGAIDARGADLTDTTLPGENGEMGVYGVPADALYGLLGSGCDPAGSVLCITSYNGSDDVSAAMLDLMLERLSAPRPEGYDDMRREKAKSAEETQIFR